MKKQTLLSLLLVVLLLVVLLLVTSFWNRANHKPVAVSSTVAGYNEKLQPPLTELERHEARNARKPTAEEWKRIMEAPVEFYGKVVDQDDKPLVGIVIRCSWPDMTSLDRLDVKSTAPDGRFEVSGRKAPEMSFGVMLPDGYRKTATTQQTFLFADYSDRLRQANNAHLGTKHLPNPANPVVFRIKKIGPADVLHKVHQGADLLPRNGTPRYYSFSEPSAKGLAQPRVHSLEVRLVSEKDPDDNAQIVPRSWSMRIRVPGGGLQPLEVEKNPVTGDYDELDAPAGSYQEEMAFDYPESMPEWRPQFDKDFFFRFPDNTYGRATISGDWERVRIQSLYNPSGSRNLLYDETKVIELKMTP